MKMLSRWFMVLVMFSIAQVSYSIEGNGPPEGEPSPNIIGRTLDDKVYRLKNDIGKPKVINFFWVKCVPCRQEMPELGVLEKQYPNVRFISVHTISEPAESVTEFLKSLSGAPSNIILTSGGVQETFRYLGLPHTIVLDGNNTVLFNLVGYTPENMERLRNGLAKLPQ